MIRRSPAPFLARTATGCGALILAVLLPAALRAQEPDIADNSFLLEEAYNQEEGVVQHISTFQRARDGGAWSYGFTQEWPAPTIRHQLSYTLSYLDLGDDGGARGLGDVALNYRYQVLGGGEADRLALAPRFSLLLPTGDDEKGLGQGGWGAQLNVPMSVQLAPTLVSHSNAGLSRTYRARNPQGVRGDLLSYNLGQSFIWKTTPKFHCMVEAVWTRGEVLTASGTREKETTFLVSPGVRFAFNLESGLQIVPGIAVPIGVGPSSGDRSIFLYLSFEHPF